jgi:hypothetical protein
MAYRARVEWVLGLVVAGVGCLPSIPDVGDAGIGIGMDNRKGVAVACMADGECRDGLKCVADSHTCQPSPTKIAGSSCTLSAECLPGYYCKPDPTAPPTLQSCQPAGMSPEGGSCSTEGDCMSGLTCLLQGLYGTCGKAGPGDVNGSCATSADCRGGLLCSESKCKTLFSVTPWEGVQSCPALEPDPAKAKVHFEVPRTGAVVHDDFFRLPFPNDIRKKNGKISLAGLPTPGPRFIPVDAVKFYTDAIQAELPSFGLNPVVYFRFSRAPAGAPAEGVRWYDITPGTSEYGFQRGRHWSTTDGGGKYICPRSISVWGDWDPLLPGRTYAVVLTNAIKEAGGKTMLRDADFEVMMGATAPTDPDLLAAWTAYEPLRKWTADTSIEADRRVPADDIIAAAVFTTDKMDDYVGGLRKAVRAAPVPEIKGMVKCAAGVTTPCADGKGCEMSDATAPYDEYQGLITIPGFQKGTPPFETVMDGGGIEYGADGLATIARTEEVCFSLTVPKGTAPEAGWPVVVYAHGTGGSFRSITVDTGLAKDIATGALGDGTGAPAATFGYDGPLHGTRKGASKKKPDELVFNYLNPRSARDTPLQGAADLFAIARALETFSAGGVKLDPKKMAVYGHSQGGNAAAVASGFEPAFGSVVLSGTGGGLVLGILGKKQPVAVAGALPFVLNDLVVTETHPVMSLMQMFFDRADPLNFARRITSVPPMDVPPHHLLHIYGSNDNYAPEATQRHFGQQAGLPVLHPVVPKAEADNLTQVMAPVKLNRQIGELTVTAVQAQYAPAMGGEGHFVSTQNADARKALLFMLATFFRDGMPIVQ